MEPELAEVLDLLGIIQAHIQSMGHIAEPKTVVEVVPHSKSGKRYARKRMTVDGKRRFEGCGQEGSEQHLDAIASVQRRQLLDKAQDLIQQVETWQQSEDWQGLKRPINAPKPIHAPKRETVTAKNPQLTPRALATDTTPTNLVSFGFKGGKGASINNRVVHAIPGEPAPPFMMWFTPALCGAEPNIFKHWGWIGDCSILYLSCKKCEKKLKEIPHNIRLPRH